MRYLVAGAGYSGLRLLRRLPPGSALALSQSGRPAPGQASLGVDLDRDTPRLEAVATVIYTLPPAPDDDGDSRLCRLLDALPAPPGRFVYLSSSGVYGDCRGARVDETAPARPATPRAQRRYRAERLLARWCEERPTSLVVLRVPGIYGPHRLGLERLGRGEAVLREADAGPGNRIHVDDLVRAMLAAADAATAPRLCNVGDGDHRSSTWFANTVADLAGLPRPPQVSCSEARRVFSARRLSFLGESRRLDTRRLREALGVTPRYADAARGIRASLAACRT